MTSGPVRRAALGAVGALVLLAVAGAPAAADPPRPTDYRSIVTEVDPPLPAGVEVRIIGGDSLVELSVPAGTTAEVADYATSADEAPIPYLRFDADGTVRRNAVAVATTANESRYGTSDRVPDPDAEPRWEVVATDGTYAWHDHRIHWMSPTAPRAVDDDGRVDLGGPDGTWTIPITIGDTPTVITGELVLVDPPSPIGWLVLALAVAGTTVAVAWRWGLRTASVIGVVTSIGVAAVTWATARAVPPGAGAAVAPVVLAAVAPVVAGLSLLPSARLRRAFVAATVACLLGWALTRWTVLVRAVLPTTLPYAADRAVTAVAVGVGVGLAAALVWRPDGEPARAGARAGVRASPTA